MKAGFVLTLAFAVLAGAASAQKLQRNKRVTQEEVPVTIVQSLQKDYSNLPTSGTWKLFYSEDTRTSKLTAELYSYSCKKDGGEKVEVFFKPDGTLDHAKGVEAASTNGSQE
ncbi:MAG: hypothetical protein WDN75_15550 [Bacteroidota bacterium]